jgi:hypothetical protein
MASLSQEEFAKASASAVVEATASREELGRARAAEFIAAPDKFDPRGLLLLGTPGLQTFASAIGIVDLGLQPISEPEGKLPRQASPASGWNAQQGRIIPFETFGTVAGIIAGVVAIATISFVTWLNH